jgi:two-component system, OmpR family, phosphate regulon response regulator PhoB
MATKLIHISQPMTELQDARISAYDDGCLRVEHDNYYVSCNGQPLQLPRKEFLIISRLTRSPERIVLLEEIWQQAWGNHTPLNAKSLHVHIYRLRRKLAPYQIRIETMVNVGYRLVTKPRPIDINR